jgi:hypothetical protein
MTTSTAGLAVTTTARPSECCCATQRLCWESQSATSCSPRAFFGQALQGARPWLLQLHDSPWLQHGAGLRHPGLQDRRPGWLRLPGCRKVLSFGHGTAYLGLLVVRAVRVAALVFRRSDVS